jgi:hypothetical protein
MTAKELEDKIPLAALGRLSSQELGELEATLAETPELALQLREYEDILGGLWLSAAPLKTAPGAAWDNIQRRTQNRSEKTIPFAGNLSWLGWAAAVLIGVSWVVSSFFESSPVPGEPSISGKEDPVKNTILPDKPVRSANPDRIARTPPTGPRARRLYELREKLQRFYDQRDAATSAPRITALHRPGAAIDTDRDSQGKRLMDLLTQALYEDIRRQNEEEVSLIIEDGWPEEGIQLAPDALVRHRRFPVEEAAELGLLVSEEGHYYDSSSGFLWQPASDGGGYLGSLAPEGLDLTAFNEPEPAPDHANDTEIREAMASVPEGYLIEGDNGEAPVFIFNGVVSADQAISLRQGNNSVPLAPDPPITDAHGSANDSSSETQNSIAGNLVPSFIFGLPPQASASVDFSQPFEVITTDPNGQQSVILTTGP